ncbi:hypothetical protein PACTADRAFT_47722 [Pachysolen tannophilus NRRL Y-2460]|uniref:Alcohol acetyltransferase n=1 Tax=Pachysolen tannophilus NRRL Y-2460 TaxID=669874 RepID=A0A1E4U1K6_PACTA|nr:hypothetical protein PACTADRAFT_47722 [Pachysolen tannophilus NRRL Y-2460]
MSVLPERNVSFFEECYYQRNVTDFYSNFFVSATYDNRKGKDFKRILAKSLRNLILKHPILYTNVYKNEKINRLVLRPVESINFKDLVEFEEHETLFDHPNSLNGHVMQEIIHSKFKYGNLDEPLWKLKVINNETLIFYCDHILFDGTSGANFHEKLLHEFNDVSKAEDETEAKKVLENNDIKLFDLEDDAQYVKPLQESIYGAMCKTDIKFIAGNLYSQYAPAWLQKIPEKLYEYFFPSPIEQSKENSLTPTGSLYENTNYLARKGAFTHDFKIVNIPPDRLSKLLKITRSNEVSLTALIMYVSLIALKNLTKDQDTITKFPISLRGKEDLGKYDTTFGLFIKSGELVLPPLTNKPSPTTTDKVDWKVVKLINDKLKEVLVDDDNFKSIAMQRLFNDTKFFVKQLNKPLSSTLEISNLGFKSFKDIDETAADFMITDMLFSQSIGALGSNFSLDVISTKLGGMNIVLTTIPELREEYAYSIDLFEKLIIELENNA